MLTSSRSYAIGSAHFQLAGGWQSMAWLCGSYIAAVFVALFIWKYEALGTPRGLTSAAVTLAIVAQAMTLLLFGSLRITKTVKVDIDTRMLESYRLMPIASSRAVISYMFGSNSHTIALALLNMLLAYIFAGVTGSSMGQVTMAMGVLAVFVLFVWSAAAMGSFHGKAMASLISIATISTTMGGFFLYQIVPAIALLLSPLAGETIFHVTSGPARLHEAYGASLVAQAAFIVIFYQVACRAYRGAAATTFSIGQSIALLLTWCASSIAGIILWEDIHLARWANEQNTPDRIAIQMVASLIVAMLLAAAPLRTMIVASASWRARRRRAATLAVLLAVALAITSIGLGALGSVPNLGWRLAITAAVVLLHVVGLYCLLWVMRFARPGPTMIALLIAGLLFWGIPPAIEFLQYNSLRDAYGNHLPTSGLAASFSPVGLLTETWRPGDHCSPLPALLASLALTAAFTAFTLKRRPRQKAVVPEALTVPMPVLSRAAITAPARAESPEV